MGIKARGQRSEVRGQMAEDRGQTADDSRQQAAGSSIQLLLSFSHMASPSLGHYAPLSFVVIGKNQRFAVGGERSDYRLRIADFGFEDSRC